MPKVSRLGHFGLRVKSLDRCLPFYRDVLGLEVTAESKRDRCSFLSSRPDEEHHELLISERPEAKKNISQISFRVESLNELKDFYRFLQERDIPIDRVRTHGHSISIYCYDPEENLIEIYWPTGRDVPAPLGKPVDLNLSEEEIIKSHLA
jgi:catechol-2,3-dioxygenase